ncbi:MAG: hypothetical protein ACM3RP_08115 [Chitinophagales bacterium]
MPGFAYLSTPMGQEERRRWFPVAGRLPEALLARGGKFVPWRVIARHDWRGGLPAGVSVGLPLSAASLAGWPEEQRQRYLIRILEGLAEDGAPLVGFRDGLGAGPAPAGLRRAVRAAARDAGTPAPVEAWAGSLAGCVAATELAARERGWDTERVEVALVGGEQPEGRVAARLVARQYGRLTLAGDAPALGRLAGQILHETGTAARVSADWPSALRRAALVVLAAPLPPGAAGLLPPGAIVVAARPGSGGVSAAFTLPGAPGVMAPADLAAVATVARATEEGCAGDLLPLVQAEEATVGGLTELREAMARRGIRPAQLLDKGGKLNL